jgi:hypothetical protein
MVEQAWYTVAVLLHLPLLSDEIKEKNEMGMACGKHWREEKHIQGFCGKRAALKTYS